MKNKKHISNAENVLKALAQFGVPDVDRVSISSSVHKEQFNCSSQMIDDSDMILGIQSTTSFPWNKKLIWTGGILATIGLIVLRLSCM